MNNAPIKKFIIATKISSVPVAALTVIPKPVKFNSSISPIIHNIIPTAYMAPKTFGGINQYCKQNKDNSDYR